MKMDRKSMMDVEDIKYWEIAEGKDGRSPAILGNGVSYEELGIVGIHIQDLIERLVELPEELALHAFVNTVIHIADAPGPECTLAILEAALQRARSYYGDTVEISPAVASDLGLETGSEPARARPAVC